MKRTVALKNPEINKIGLAGLNKNNRIWEHESEKGENVGSGKVEEIQRGHADVFFQRWENGELGGDEMTVDGGVLK